MSNVNKELEEMKRLINFGRVDESSSNSVNKPILEFTQKGADGKNYAVAHVCNKYYIMEAPTKDTKVLAEDYDYVGGFDNRKAYASYTEARKQFDFKMKSLNEAYMVEQPVLFESAQSDWQDEKTIAMRGVINRLNQISNNVDMILEGDTRKGVGFGPVGDKAPYDEKANASRDTDWTNKDEKPSKKVDNTNDEVGSSHATDKAGKNTTGYTEKAPKGKDLKEGRTIKLTEEQVLAWNRDNDDYMDKSHGTEIGDTAPYCTKGCSGKECSCGTVCESEDNIDFNIDLGTDTINDIAGLEGIEDDGTAFGDDDTSGPMPTDNLDGVRSGNAPFEGSDEEFDDFVYDELGNGNDPSVGLDDEDDDPELEIDNLPAGDPNAVLESIIRESVLNDFGNHPAYRKKPFTLPGNQEPASKDWAHRWDNESNLNDEEFGKQIGHNGDPFTQKVVDMLTNTIMAQMSQKKKSK